MQYFSPKYSGVILVIISSICFAFVPNSAKIALDEGASLSFLLVSRYAIGVALLLPIMLYKKTKLVSKICKTKGFKIIVSSNP